MSKDLTGIIKELLQHMLSKGNFGYENLSNNFQSIIGNQKNLDDIKKFIVDGEMPELSKAKNELARAYEVAKNMSVLFPAKTVLEYPREDYKDRIFIERSGGVKMPLYHFLTRVNKSALEKAVHVKVNYGIDKQVGYYMSDEALYSLPRKEVGRIIGDAISDIIFNDSEREPSTV